MQSRLLIVAGLLIGIEAIGTATHQAAAIQKQPATKKEGVAQDDTKKSAAGAKDQKANKKAEKAKAKAAAKKDAPPKPVVRGPVTWNTPKLPVGKLVVTDTSTDFLKSPGELLPEVKIAKQAPTVDFGYYPCQTYAAELWSNWGDSLCANGKYYASLGDHMYPGKDYKSEPGRHGAGYVYEYDPVAKAFRLLMDTSQVLKDVPEGEYLPGKIHSRLDLGSDGWIYCGTQRGAATVTNERFNYKGDWILRCHPSTGQAEIVAHAPVPNYAIPTSAVDPQRMIFYGSGVVATADKSKPEEKFKFFAYDLQARRVLHTANYGPERYLIVAPSTGKVYYTPGLLESPLMCYDPSSGKPPYEIPGVEIGIRAATRETSDGKVFTVSQEDPWAKKRGEKTHPATLYAFDTKTEKVEVLGPSAIAAGRDYVAAMSADPTGRYVYYTLGAHGGSEKSGSALVQFDTHTKTKKVVAFLAPLLQKKYGVTPIGSYSIAVDEKGETVYITWNMKRDELVKGVWDVVGMTAVHIPASERQP